MQHSDAALKRLAAVMYGRILGVAQTAPRVSGGLRPDADPVRDHVGWEVWAFYVRRKGGAVLHCPCCGQRAEALVVRGRPAWGRIGWGRAVACWLDGECTNARELALNELELELELVRELAEPTPAQEYCDPAHDLASEPAPVCAFCLDAPASVYAGEPEEALCVICAKRVELDEAGQ